MPYDKIVDSAKLDGAMTATADAIRGKTGKTADIPWNESTGFASEIASIQTETAPKLQSKSATPSTSAQTVKPDSGYDGLSQVTVNAMPTATQAIPSISVSTSGLITASATQSAGYVAAGTKSATKQLTTQAAKTITPSTADQSAVASGVYTTGAVTVKGDSNLKAANIAKGVSIFGVTGMYTGGTQIATGTFQDATGDAFTKIGGLTISGIPFKPSRVIIYPATTGTISHPCCLTFADSSGSFCYSGYWEEYYDEDADEYYDELYIRRFTDSDGFEFTLTNDGFNLHLAYLDDASRHYIELDTGAYNYIAFS